jgi:hypothetical protein
LPSGRRSTSEPFIRVDAMGEDAAVEIEIMVIG